MEQEVKVYNARKIVELIAQDIRQVMFKMVEIEETKYYLSMQEIWGKWKQEL